MKIAINGFGRIGRNFLRALRADTSARDLLDLVAINLGPARPEMAAHMFKYDTLLGKYPGSVELRGDQLVVDGQAITLLTELDPEKTGWRKLGIDWVVEASGRFTSREGAEKHLEAGARGVLITAPATGEDITIIPGVNEDRFESSQKIVSLGSCTSNAVIPVLKVLNDSFGVRAGCMTTIHAYTNTQVLLDVEHKDLRRSRAAAVNIIPTTTGATKVLAKVMPELEGKVGGKAVRVPVPDVSLLDLVFTTKKELSVEKIKQAFVSAQQASLKNILATTDRPLVSTDFIGDPHSVIIDLSMTDVRGSMGKVFGWYDNEWGYSVRLKDFLMRVA